MRNILISAVPIGIIVVENDADLEQVRKHINRLHSVRSKFNIACCFFLNCEVYKTMEHDTIQNSYGLGIS